MDHISDVLELEILMRDLFTCRRCGSKDNLSVHHITPRKLGGTNNPKELLTMCDPCHDWADEKDERTWSELTTPPVVTVDKKKKLWWGVSKAGVTFHVAKGDKITFLRFLNDDFESLWI